MHYNMQINQFVRNLNNYMQNNLIMHNIFKLSL